MSGCRERASDTNVVNSFILEAKVVFLKQSLEWACRRVTLGLRGKMTEGGGTVEIVAPGAKGMENSLQLLLVGRVLPFS